MRKLLLGMVLFLLALAVIPVVSAQEDGLDQDEIRAIAERVVLIGIFDGGEFVGNGSGTIVHPSGIVFTNRHVAEDAETLGIFMLSDIGELPELRYFASVVQMSDQIDFAILQIDRDANGNRLDPETLNLPFLPLDVQTVDIGDEVSIFGYPGIGDGYMVVTRGEVVTIQNGNVNGERVPVWYRTDSEFSGGNSGGLAVNTAGQPVGIPTWIVTEDRTSGKLGGLLPLSTVLALIDDLDTFSDDSSPLVEEAPVPGSGQSLILNNNSQTVVCFVNISPSTSSSWGDNQLGSEEAIQPGATRTWEIFAGVYDVRLLDCQGETIADTRNIEINTPVMASFSGGTQLALDGAAPAPTSPEVSVPETNNTLTGGISVTCEGVQFTNGTEIIIENVPVGEEYRVTVVGLNGFDPVLAVFNGSSDGRCSDDADAAGDYAAALPSTGQAAPSPRSSQLRFSRATEADATAFSVVVGEYNSQPGEFLIFVEGPSVQASDGTGDVYAINLLSGLANVAVPVRFYMISAEQGLDPLVYLVDGNVDNVADSSGAVIYCDDAGTTRCWGDAASSTLDSSSLSLISGDDLPGTGLDAALSLPVDLQRTLGQQVQYINILASSYERQSAGRYIAVFHLGTG